MTVLRVTLFGRMKVAVDGTPVGDLGSSKARALLGYLLLHRDRAHPRERLGSLLWGHVSTERSKAYLRKALWKIQTALKPVLGEARTSSMIQVKGDWIQCTTGETVWLDVEVFESAIRAVRDRPVEALSMEEVERLEEAVGLYTSDLLENWYLDWCLIERERLQDLYLTALGKLVRHAETIRSYDTGIAYGIRMLHVDPARECAHRCLMRLRYLSGDRTGALRQYARCAEVLRAEFGVRPSATTRTLHAQIQKDRLQPSAPAVSVDAAWPVEEPTDASEEASPPVAERIASLPDGQARIQELRSALLQLQAQIRREIEAMDGTAQRPTEGS